MSTTEKVKLSKEEMSRRMSRPKLTPKQRAEAAALYRTGEMTIEEIAKKYDGRSAEGLGRLFRRMGVVKGDLAEEKAKEVIARVGERMVSETEKTLERINTTRDEHYTMSRALAKMAFGEIARAKQAGLDLGELKERMLTLKLASEIVGTARKELYALLDVERHQKLEENDDLPELTVRELSQDDIEEIQNQTSAGSNEMLDDYEAGAGMIDTDLDSEEGDEE